MNLNNIKSLFRLKVLTSYGNIASNIALGFACLYFLNKYASVSVYGQFILFKSTAGLMAGVLSVRSSDVVIKFFKEFEALNQFSYSLGIIRLGLLLDVVTSILIYTFIYFSATLGAKFLELDATTLDIFIVFGLTSFFAYLRGTPIGYLQSIGKFTTVNIITMLESVSILIVMAYISIIHKKITLEFIVYLHVTAYFCTSILLYYFFYWYHKSNVNFKGLSSSLPIGFMKKFIKYTSAFFLSSIFKAVNQNGDNLLIGYFLSSLEVGIYQTVKKLYSLIEIVVQPLAILMYPKLVSIYSRGKYKDFVKCILYPQRYILVISLGYMFLISFFLNELFDYFQISFREEYYYISIFVGLGYVISSLIWWARIFSNIIDPMISVKANVFTSIYLICISSVFLFSLKLTGLSISFFILNLLLAIYIFYLFNDLRGEQNE